VSDAKRGDLKYYDQIYAITMLRQATANAQSQAADPWHLRLERVRGKVGDDGVERIATQALFDLLEVAQRSRSTAACRRLARIMRELGWSAMKARGLTQAGYRDQVRGYARAAFSRQNS
jgi:hypothetical protein